MFKLEFLAKRRDSSRAYGLVDKQWEVNQPALSSAHKLWNQLIARIREELDDYDTFAREHSDEMRIEKIRLVQEWMSGKGALVRAELERQIVNAEVKAAEEMRISIEAALELLDLERARDLSVPQNRDYLLETCQEMFYSLRRAFRDIAISSWPEPTELFVPRRDVRIEWAPTRGSGTKAEEPMAMKDPGAAAA